MRPYTSKGGNPTITLADAMWSGILEDMRTLRVPVNVKSFSELHDYVDANAYGGLCDEQTLDALIAQFGGRDADDSMPPGAVDLINEAQGRVSRALFVGSVSYNFNEVDHEWLTKAAPLIWTLKQWERRHEDLKSALRGLLNAGI